MKKRVVKSLGLDALSANASLDG